MPRGKALNTTKTESNEPKKSRTRKPLMGVGTVETIEIDHDEPKRSIAEGIKQAIEADRKDTEKLFPHLKLNQLLTEEIHKVKWSGNGAGAIVDFKEITIHYTTRINEGEPIKCELELNQEPDPDFFTTLNQLMPLVMDTVGLSDNWKDFGWVSGVTLKAEAKDFYGVVITAQRDKGEGRDVVSTRYLKAEDLDQHLLGRIIQQCRYYIHGHRKPDPQLSLFDGGDA